MSSPENAGGQWPPQTLELLDRLAAIQRSPRRYVQPIGIIGPGDGGAAECAAAFAAAGCFARAGMSIICGGRGGVMEAASRAAAQAGGIVVGILPEEDTRAANPYLTVAIPTGMGEMRNAIIARSSLCLLAIGGGLGTISEIALGLKWGKPVFCLHEEVQLRGATITSSTGQLIEAAAAWLVEASS